MSNRNLVDYFSPTNAKKQVVAPVQESSVTEKATHPKLRRGRKNKVPACDNTSDDDFLDEPILPPQNGNSITKYFSPVDRASALSRKKTASPCVVTVQAEVYGSPKKTGNQSSSKRPLKKKRKKKVGLPGSQADQIEVVSSEAVLPSPVSSPLKEAQKPAGDQQPTSEESKLFQALTNVKPRWKMRICMDENGKESEEEAANSSDVSTDGPRRSARIRSRPTTLPISEAPEDMEEEELPTGKKVPRKRRRKEKTALGTNSGVESDSDIEVVSASVAPLFRKKQQQEEARAIKKAKQEFLFSGVPEVLKQQVIVQQALEQRPVEIFPKVSHVTQAGSRPWALPYPAGLDSILLPHREHPIHFPTTFSADLNARPTAETPTTQLVVQAASMEWRYCKDWITLLKEDHGLSFPFFRTLCNLLPKANRNEGEALWTDVYAPSCSADILSTNKSTVGQLKTWLTQWKLRAGEVVEPQPKKLTAAKNGKKKRKRMDSEDGTDPEEYVSDERSNGSWKSEEEMSSSVLLVGPSGCGKTAAVYALAEELGYNVLEVNTSSRRNGKTVLSHLHEATQSHSLNNTTPTGATGFNKLFFGGPKPAAKAEEPKPSLSLVLFEDVDIVFESEDESFYAALSTLILTTKRPVIMTLGSTEARTLDIVQEKIKSHYDVITLNSPDLPTTCGFLWSVCLTEGYPLEWEALTKWVEANREGPDLDLRACLNDLQFLLEHHPLRLKLNFSQLQLKNKEGPVTVTESGEVGSSSHRPSGLGDVPVHPIKLPQSSAAHSECPYSFGSKPSRFSYDPKEGLIILGGERKYSRIVSNTGLFDTEETPTEELPPPPKEKWRGDLTPLVQSLHFQASQDHFRSVRSSSDLSWTDATLLQDMEELLLDGSMKLLEKEMGGIARETAQEKISRLKCEESTRSAHQDVLYSSVSKSQWLQRSAHNHDLLPFLRSMVRSDLDKSEGKRRRKPARSSSTVPASTRLGTLDLVLPTSSVLQLANTF